MAPLDWRSELVMANEEGLENVMKQRCQIKSIIMNAKKKDIPKAPTMMQQQLTWDI